MAAEQSSADVDLVSGTKVSDMPDERSKPSFLSRITAKAKKLKSKVKSHGSTEDSQDEPPKYPLSAGQDESDSDASESDQEGDKHDVPYTPLSNAVLPHPQRPAGATVREAEGAGTVNSGRSAVSTESSTNTDQSRPVDPSLLKTGGPPRHEQAVPTNYNYFNSEPLKAESPVNQDASQRRTGVPSALGGEVARLSPATSKSSNDSRNSFLAQDGSLPKSGESDFGGFRSFVGSKDVTETDAQRAITTKPLEQDQGVKLPEPSSTSALTPRNSLNGFSELTGADAPQQSVLETLPTANSVTDGFNNDKPFTSSEEGQALGHSTVDTAESAKEVMDGNWNPPSEEATWTQKANGLKDSLASTFGYAGNSAASNAPSNEGEQKPFMDRVTETAYSLKAAVVGKSNSADQITSTDSIPISQKVTDSVLPGEVLSTNAIHSGDHDLSRAETPVAANASEGTLQAREAGLQKTIPDDQGKGFSDTITESIVGLPGMLSSKLGLGGGRPTSLSPTGAEALQPGSGFKDGSHAPTASTPPTSNTPYDPSTRKDTPYPDHASATSTGLFDRVSDIASSLFGLGSKQPPTELGKSSSLEAAKQPPTELSKSSSVEGTKQPPNELGTSSSLESKSI